MMATTAMDSGFDNHVITFDLQSSYLSYEERRWLNHQRHTHKLDSFVKSVADFQTQIRGHEQFSIIPQSLSSKSMISKVDLKNTHSLYDAFPIDGYIDNEVDRFRLYHQQMCQLIFADLSTEKTYQIFFMILEGLMFYVAATVDQYRSLWKHEMHKCLNAFPSFIQTRTERILTILRCFNKGPFPRYVLVHSYAMNNCGILFQTLPKLPGIIPPRTECDWILSADAFGDEILSPEELRYINYLLSMKQKDPLTIGITPKIKVPKQNTPPTLFGTGSIPVQTFEVLHSLPIVYPYDETTIYQEGYPKFWTNTNRFDDSSSALFYTTPLENKSPEYIFVERSFYKTVPKDELLVTYVERVENAHLWEKFSAHRKYMRRKNGADDLNENWLFHGTKSDNRHQILAHGFNRSYCRDGVLYGHGVYFSRFAAYSVKYSDRDELSCIFFCRVLVGRHTLGGRETRTPPKIRLPNNTVIEADSTTDDLEPFSIACTYHDDQNYPEYIIGYRKAR